MREIPVNDFFAKNGKLREDGRLLHDMYLVQVKTPAESRGPWDYYKIIAAIPGDQAFRPAGEDGCPLDSQMIGRRAYFNSLATEPSHSPCNANS